MKTKTIPHTLIEAVRNDDPSALHSTDFDHRDSKNQSLLFYIVRQNALSVLNAFADLIFLNALNSHGDTPLHVAASIGNHEVLKRLLEAGADPSLENKKGMTPIMAAARKGSHPAIRTLLKKDVLLGKTDKFGNSVLFYAVESDSPLVFETLVDSGADPHHVNNQGETLHHIAAKHASLKMVETLEAYKIPLHVFSDYKQTPLHHASRKGKADLVEFYLERGLSPELEDGFSMSARAYGNDYGDIEMKFTRFENSNAMQAYPLSNALRKEDFEKAFVLIREGKNLDQKDVYGNRPVYYALMHRQYEIYQALMERGIQKEDIDRYHHDISYYMNFLNLNW